MICYKCNDEVIVLAVCSGGVLQCRRCERVRLKVSLHGVECAAESPAGSRGKAAEGGGQGKPHEAVGFLALG